MVSAIGVMLLAAWPKRVSRVRLFGEAFDAGQALFTRERMEHAGAVAFIHQGEPRGRPMADPNRRNQ